VKQPKGEPDYFNSIAISQTFIEFTLRFIEPVLIYWFLIFISHDLSAGVEMGGNDIHEIEQNQSTMNRIFHVLSFFTRLI
jgi:hypothetical protein